MAFRGVKDQTMAHVPAQQYFGDWNESGFELWKTTRPAGPYEFSNLYSSSNGISHIRRSLRGFSPRLHLGDVCTLGSRLHQKYSES